MPFRLINVLLASKNVQRRCSECNLSRSMQRLLLSTQNGPNNNDQSSSTSFVLRSVYDNSSKWEDWFPAEEYGHPYEIASSWFTKTNANQMSHHPMILESLEGDSGLDASSRHLIRSLQIIYMYGYYREVTTTQSCQAMMHRLFQSADEILKSDPKGENSALQARQRVIRAEAILRTMELFWDFVPDLIEDTHPRKRFLRTNNYRTHKPAVELPLPTSHMYSTLLVKLANLRAPKQYQHVNYADIPRITQDLVLRYHRYHQVKGVNYIKKPATMDWNQALLTWANAHGSRDHPEKAVHATQFFMDMTLQYKVQPDISSYGHVLRACAHPDENAKATLLGPKVAIKFWNGVVEEALEMQSVTPIPHLFVFFMRAVGHHPETKEAEYYLEKAWKRACDAGVVNEHVLRELKDSSRRLYERLIGEYRSNRRQDSNKTDSSYKELMANLPSEWTRNANRGSMGVS